ncbi:MAG: hypothetical protein V3W19_04065 [Desulfatiglandales bacterium]
MKEKIASIVKELQFATSDEIKLVLGDARKKTIDYNLEKMEDGGEVIRILPSENSLEKEGIIEGPNLDVGENIEIREMLAEKDLHKRIDIINWDVMSKRLIKELNEKIDILIEDIEHLYKDPKNLELEYFDYSIKYHELYGLLNKQNRIELLNPLNDSLEKCRSFLDKLDYGEAP